MTRMRVNRILSPKEKKKIYNALPVPEAWGSFPKRVGKKGRDGCGG